MTRHSPSKPSIPSPIPARAAVSSFTMIKQDGTRIVGSVLEKFEAKQTYDDAVSKGHQASLMEQQTPDVFRVAVGNIPSHEQVQIELVYSTELAEDEESDSVRFHLPVHIGARYGEAPADFVPPPSSSSPFLTISTSVEALAPISNIGSPSHTVRTELGPDPALPNFKDLPSSHYARITLSSDTALDKDFVLTFKSAGLDSPRCVAELHPTNDTTALALSLVPRFTLPDLARQEFILVVDRSGSMAGERIAAARKALIVLLSALPHKDTLFQIVSFGHRATSLWPAGSRAYNEATLAEAMRHVDGMHADYGGTEIGDALRHTFAKRARDRPTSVLVLTDGDAWDLEGVLGSVSHAVEDAPEGAPLRVSVLGIGGRGLDGDLSFAGKVARLLKAAKTPVISNITIDWGRLLVEPEGTEGVSAPDDPALARVEEEAPQNKTLNVFDVNVDPTLLDKTVPPPAPPVILPPPPPVQQSPFKIRNFFPGSRLNITSTHTSFVAVDEAQVQVHTPLRYERPPSRPGVVQAADHVDNLILYDHDELDESDFRLFAAAVDEAEDDGAPQRYFKTESIPKPVRDAVRSVLQRTSRTNAFIHGNGQPQKAPEPGIFAWLLDRIQSPFSAPHGIHSPESQHSYTDSRPRSRSKTATRSKHSRVCKPSTAPSPPRSLSSRLSLSKTDTRSRTCETRFPQGAADELVATVLALAHAGQKMKVIGLDGHDGSDAWAWAGMHEKASEWVEGSLRDMGAQERVKELEEKVAAMLAVI
ncbi:hypothetical protein MSAN_01969400 [Mycena sanguinolenta]|uniref:Uncharacterized protein n=1 Tax=Mycena sanguinolenta TaxID=230812 RepID=A0A8H6XP24_9AGAR|nr:hypothetical protein MSAN_01969400 [Mycena sanguinolenta]